MCNSNFLQYILSAIFKYCEKIQGPFKITLLKLMKGSFKEIKHYVLVYMTVIWREL